MWRYKNGGPYKNDIAAQIMPIGIKLIHIMNFQINKIAYFEKSQEELPKYLKKNHYKIFRYNQ